MKKHSPLILLIILFVTSAFTQEIQSDVEYNGETILKSSPYGVAFLLPADWAGIFRNNSDFFFMKNINYEGYIFIKFDKMTATQAKQTMSKPIVLSDGIIFHPKSQITALESTLVAEYTVSGTQNPLSGLIKTIIGDYGQGVSFFAASPVKDGNKIQSDLNKITASLKLSEPKQNRTSNSKKVGSPWFEHLNGRKLSYFQTAAGYTEEDYIWLCNNGYFYKSTHSDGIGSEANGDLHSKNGGRWSVSGTLQRGTLLLTYNDGRILSYILTHEGKKLFLDGKLYIRERVSCQ